MNNLKIIGYYLCQPVDVPPFLEGISDTLISVSGCIGMRHPIWECIFGCWLEGEEEEYMAACQLDRAQMDDLRREALALFEERRLDVDSRFADYDDAQQFMRKFFSHIDCRLVCLATDENWLGRLEGEFAGTESRARINGGDFACAPVGCDILGWDFNGFHSFLCNSLHNGMPMHFSDCGLLADSFEQTAQFAEELQGYGEPVLWIPCAVGLCDEDHGEDK